MLRYEQMYVDVIEECDPCSTRVSPNERDEDVCYIKRESNCREDNESSPGEYHRPVECRIAAPSSMIQVVRAHHEQTEEDT